jgi:hypothetical protein
MSTKIEFPKNGFSFYDLLKMSKATSDKEEINIDDVSSKLKSNGFSQKYTLILTILRGDFYKRRLSIATSFVLLIYSLDLGLKMISLI